MDPVSHVAEDILPGHPDRLADAIAESIVDTAVARDPDALAGVEVAVHRKVVYVTGRVAANGLPDRLDLDAIVRAVYARAGYAGPWSLIPRAEHDLDVGPLADDERAIRRFSDDQDIVTGYACAGPDGLPPAVSVARRLKSALAALRTEHADELGPDGKVLVRLSEIDGVFRWDNVNVSLQHRPDVGFERLHALVLPRLEAVARDIDRLLPGLAASWHPDVARVNGAGQFSCGGPLGDNGLSGKKLVVDHYGPSVPIGGGALCGKDPHKVDRIGALRARQVGKRLVARTGARDALVQLGYLPGREAPEFLVARVDGEPWDADRIARAIPVPDLSIEASFRELELAGVRWSDVLAKGYFGGPWAWERA